MGWPTTIEAASSMVARMASPPGTSPRPVRPELSLRMIRLRVKKGPCAPDRFISMLSWPATGMTRNAVTSGVREAFRSCMVSGSFNGNLARFDQVLPAGRFLLLVGHELLGRVADNFEADIRE